MRDGVSYEEKYQIESVNHSQGKNTCCIMIIKTVTLCTFSIQDVIYDKAHGNLRMRCDDVLDLTCVVALGNLVTPNGLTNGFNLSSLSLTVGDIVT